MIQPKCVICFKDLMSNDGYKIEYEGEKEIKTLVEPQVSYWTHDPRNLHVDVKVTVHQPCYDKVKAVNEAFDEPLEDYATFKYPTLDKAGNVVLKTPTKFKTDQDSSYEATKAEKGII